MVEVIKLAAHDPIPDSADRQVVVLHRFAEDDPDGTETTVTLTGHPDHTEHPVHPDGRAMTLEEAIDEATQLAQSRRIARIYVIDRTEGAREQDILQHGGDHSVDMDGLSDDDLEDGEHGPDMRDRGR